MERGTKMNTSEIEILENELKKNTEILENSFEQFNLKVLSVAYSGSKYDGDISFWIEIAAINGTKIMRMKGYSCLEIKLNFYENDKLICSAKIQKYKDCFTGYDTLNGSAGVINLIQRATRVRIFATL